MSGKNLHHERGRPRVRAGRFGKIIKPDFRKSRSSSRPKLRSKPRVKQSKSIGMRLQVNRHLGQPLVRPIRRTMVSLLARRLAIRDFIKERMWHSWYRPLLIIVTPQAQECPRYDPHSANPVLIIGRTVQTSKVCARKSAKITNLTCTHNR